ncbi:hypothetical protein AVEN_171633-1 [Araneus ventricosus]|uniref:Uncharacterized protein n=1 Tax=Araneus ventricosus TaxID=182803 RepID=A0A4Y2F2P5_ARAVE|nr:hypothetical protein AVEN_171633-1 [Araneus ventricosus]
MMHVFSVTECLIDRTFCRIELELQNLITGFVENLPLQQLRNVWIQHDGALPHKSLNVKLYLMETSQNQVIGYGGFVERPRAHRIGLLLMGTDKGAGICDPSANIAGSSKTHYWSLCIP